MGITSHCCIALDKILELYVQGKGGWIEANGRTLTEQEVYALVRDEKAKGYIYFSGCDNRRPDGSCAGHKQDDKPLPLEVK